MRTRRLLPSQCTHCTHVWCRAGNSLPLCSLSSVLRKFTAGVESGTYPAAPKLEGMDVAAFAHMQDQREWEVRRTIALCLAQEITPRLVLRSQLLMEYVIPFASMIKGAALPTLPAPPSLPDYGTHKVRVAGLHARTSACSKLHVSGVGLSQRIHARAVGILRSCWRAHPAFHEGRR